MAAKQELLLQSKGCPAVRCLQHLCAQAPTLTQMPQPIQSSSEIHATLEAAVTSIHSFPAAAQDMTGMNHKFGSIAAAQA